MVKSITDRCGARIFARRLPRLVVPIRSIGPCELHFDLPCPSSGLLTHSQVGYPQQIVSPSYEIGPCLRPFYPAVATAPQSAHRFHPAEDFFHPFAKPLAGAVTGPSSRVSIQSANSNPLFARHVRCHGSLPAPGHKLLLVIRFIRSQGCDPGLMQLAMFLHLAQGHRRLILRNRIVHRDGRTQPVSVPCILKPHHALGLREASLPTRQHGQN